MVGVSLVYEVGVEWGIELNGKIGWRLGVWWVFGFVMWDFEVLVKMIRDFESIVRG